MNTFCRIVDTCSISGLYRWREGDLSTLPEIKNRWLEGVRTGFLGNQKPFGLTSEKLQGGGGSENVKRTGFKNRFI